jgi:cytochrome c biogenesis protein CcmG, thiol:disulfide interchange protein DsbE
MTTRADRTRGMPRRSRVEPASRPSRAPLLMGGAVVLLLAIAAVGAVGLSATPPTGLAEPADTPLSVSGTALPELSDPANDAAVGLPIPALVGTDVDGNPMTVGPDDGAMAIVVLAHWCSHCQAEVPLLADYLATTGMPDGVRLVGVSTAIDPARPNYPPSSWLEREGWTVPTLVDDAASGGLTALGVSSFPGFVFVDADGTVTGRFTGEMPMAAFDEAVRALAP